MSPEVGQGPGGLTTSPTLLFDADSAELPEIAVDGAVFRVPGLLSLTPPSLLGPVWRRTSRIISNMRNREVPLSPAAVAASATPPQFENENKRFFGWLGV